MSSFTPVRVTVCAVLQLTGVKVTLAGLTVTSVVSLLVIVNDTSAVGSEFSTTVKVACTPLSLVGPLIAAQIGALLPRGQGVIERVVTVTGPAVRHPGNYLVPVGTPGVTITRPMQVFGYNDAPEGHAEIVFDNARVPYENLLGSAEVQSVTGLDELTGGGGTDLRWL